MLKQFIRAFSSLKLTVVCLAMGCVIIFWGTIAQVHLGLYKAQNEFFRSFLIYWQPTGESWKIPVFPGGYLVGGVLLINLMVAHVRYYQPGRKKIGVALIHLGIVLLLVGQMLTDVLANESVLHLRNGEVKNYSESDRNYELAITDTTDPQGDNVVAVPASLLAKKGYATNPDLPFTIRVKQYFANSELAQASGPGLQPVKSTAGFDTDFWWREVPRATVMERKDLPSATVEITGNNESAGIFLVSAYLNQPQTFTYHGRHYELRLRAERFYLPFSLQLLEFKHDKYPGTDIPKNFSSRVRLQQPTTHEDREVLVYMNNPLRYGGETFYQASFDPDDRGSVFQVVRNPGWLTPYFACALVGIGLTVQFLMHLIPFLKRRLA